MLIQLHFQPKDFSKSDQTEFIAQTEIENNISHKDYLAKLRKFMEETFTSHPLPKTHQWLLVQEGSDKFVWAKK